MSATVAARSAFSFAATRSYTASRFAPAVKPGPGSGPKAAAAFSPFRTSKQSPVQHRIFRLPVEMSSCVESMLPYHTATASALLTSKLSVSRCCRGWTLDDRYDDV